MLLGYIVSQRGIEANQGRLNSTRSLTLETIKVALTKNQIGNTDVGKKETKEGENKGISKYSEIL